LEKTLAQNGRAKTICSTSRSRAKDPLLIYKLEAFNLFRAMIDNANKEVISFLFKEFASTRNQRIQEAIDVTSVGLHRLR
jgi:preprotein translocase subunit SecA